MSQVNFSSTEIYEIKPENFESSTQVVGCYLEAEGHLLVLKYGVSKSEAGKWAVPGGKVERKELPKEAAKRELFEETGIEIQETWLRNLGTLYIRNPNLDYVYHLFNITLPTKPKVIQLSDEHSAYLWAKAQDLKILPLLDGEQEILQKYGTFLAQNRITASVNAFLILRNKDQILLMLRQNTGFLDDHWGLVSGHVEPGESATEGIIREAKEELGIDISSSELKVAHVMHRKTNRLNIDIFFECSQWKGEISNQEPEKCKAIDFFSFVSFPDNAIDYNIFALNLIAQGQFYSEWGF